MSDSRRALPSVNALLESAGVRALLERAPRTIVVEAVREIIGRYRDETLEHPADDRAWVDEIAARVALVLQPSLRSVINATGIVLHTNLGRAPLPRVALDAIARVARGYSNLEYNLGEGTRGSRYVHCASLLRELTGAEDALVVNNCAAALVLSLNTLAEGREAIISRGELVEIGGSFRIHEIMAKSGAFLREVGSTNRTHVADYMKAMSRATGAILKVHRSNFAVEGFVAEASVRDLAPLARQRALPVVHDLGSGLLISLASIGLTGEPTAREALAAGAAIVVMSGDKLLGGPQAGIILGARQLIDAMRRNPLTRSFRVDKLTLSALEATLALYREPARALREIPTLALLGAPVEELRERATRVANALLDAGVECSLVDSISTVGAGAFSRAQLPSIAISLSGNAEECAARLRRGAPAVVGRVHDGRLLLDFRAISDGEVAGLISAVTTARG
ncbi:MAG: L-seryl-tRNA(Sec) selenium transferase [Gemmatimonadota bacterium]